VNCELQGCKGRGGGSEGDNQQQKPSATRKQPATTTAMHSGALCSSRHRPTNATSGTLPHRSQQQQQQQRAVVVLASPAPALAQLLLLLLCASVGAQRGRPSPPGYLCDFSVNFVPSVSYSQVVLDSQQQPGTISFAVAVARCSALCDDRSPCTGFFYQKHANSHQVCGLFAAPTEGAAAVRHGHDEGVVCRGTNASISRPARPPPSRPPPAPAPPPSSETVAFCAQECRARGHCCNDHRVGSNQLISCSQACVLRRRGMGVPSCLALCSAQTSCPAGAGSCGCTVVAQGLRLSLCQRCQDLHSGCPHGVQAGAGSCEEGCRMAPPPPPPRPPPPRPPPPPGGGTASASAGVRALELVMALDLASIQPEGSAARRTFEANFRRDVAAHLGLGISTARIIIDSISSGPNSAVVAPVITGRRRHRRLQTLLATPTTTSTNSSSDDEGLDGTGPPSSSWPPASSARRRNQLSSTTLVQFSVLPDVNGVPLAIATISAAFAVPGSGVTVAGAAAACSSSSCGRSSGAAATATATATALLLGQQPEPRPRGSSSPTATETPRTDSEASVGVVAVVAAAGGALLVGVCAGMCFKTCGGKRQPRLSPVTIDVGQRGPGQAAAAADPYRFDASGAGGGGGGEGDAWSADDAPWPAAGPGMVVRGVVVTACATELSPTAVLPIAHVVQPPPVHSHVHGDKTQHLQGP
jgi:hypothetical protein